MTVCASALAAESKAIVVIADKALTYGGYIQWDADSTKIFGFPHNKAIALISGDEQATTRMLGYLALMPTLGQDRPTTWKFCEEIYKKCADDLIEANFLTPRLLTRQEYIAAISQTDINAYIHNVAKSIDGYQMSCEIILCGFDSGAEPHIFHLAAPGIVTDMVPTGFHAIGSGAEKAVSRLLWSETKRAHPIERVLFDAFDAKANAEMAVGVGYEWDAEVMIAGKPDRSTIVPKEIKELIEQAWAKYNRSPFENRKKDDIPSPPTKWRKKLEDWVHSVAA